MRGEGLAARLVSNHIWTHLQIEQAFLIFHIEKHEKARANNMLMYHYAGKGWKDNLLKYPGVNDIHVVSHYITSQH